MNKPYTLDDLRVLAKDAASYRHVRPCLEKQRDALTRLKWLYENNASGDELKTAIAEVVMRSELTAAAYRNAEVVTGRGGN